MKNNILHALLGLFCVCNSNAQTVTKNQQGEKIVQFDDGSWRYYQASDSIYLLDNQKQKEPTNSPSKLLVININDYVNQLFTSLDTEIKELKLKQQDLQKSKHQKKTIIDQILKAEAINQPAYQVAINDLHILNQESVHIEKQLQIAKELYIQLSIFKNQDKASLVENLKAINLHSNQNKELSTDEIIRNYLLHASTTNDANEATNAPMDTSTESKIKESSISKKASQQDPTPTSIETKKTNTEPTLSMLEIKYTGKPYIEKRKPISVENNQVLPYVERCNVLRNGNDEFTDNFILEVGYENLISYTPEKLRGYFPTGDLITSKVSIQYSKGLYLLSMISVIANKNADKTFSGIKKGSSFIIKLVNGKTVNLKSNLSAKGKYMNASESYVYRSNYYLDDSHIKLLEQYPIDKIRMVWETGFEDYPIHNVDALMQLITCLNKNL